MPNLDPVFDRLSQILRKHTAGLAATRDDTEQLYVMTTAAPSEFFGAVMRKKSQVAYHLMPVYRDPKRSSPLGWCTRLILRLGVSLRP